MRVENTVYTKIYGFKITRNIFIKIGFKTLKYLRLLLSEKYKFFEHSKNFENRKVRSKGKLYQTEQKQYRIFLLIIGWDITKEHKRRDAYIYFHKKKYLNRQGFFERLKKELKVAFKGLN